MSQNICFKARVSQVENKVNTIEKIGESVVLTPVESEEAKSFSVSTPSASLSFFLTNKDKFGTVKVGDVFLVKLEKEGEVVEQSPLKSEKPTTTTH